MNIQEAPLNLRRQISPDMRREFVNPYMRGVQRAEGATSSPRNTPLAAVIDSRNAGVIDTQCAMAASEALDIDPTLSSAIYIRDHGIDAPVEMHGAFRQTLRRRPHAGTSVIV